ncbi:MAG: alkaline phosphatase [Acidobacteria bacterium]|nr:alkaline phosphatase [Acidobacteriota bacterium]
MQLLFFLLALFLATRSEGATTIRIMPADDGVLAVGQRFDIRVETTAGRTSAPRELTVIVNGVNVTPRNVLDPGVGGERGAGGTGATATALPPHHRAASAPPNTTNFLLRDFVATRPGPLTISARTADGTMASVRLLVEPWEGAGRSMRARNVILLLGDGMGAAHRTAARIVSRGLHNGKAAGRLAMDRLDVTGVVMTASLNATITDSSPGMSSYVTGQKHNNNQEGVFPDNTPDAFDNPRVEYLGELLRRSRGRGFHVGIVTTADVTDSTPAANAVHTSDRYAGAGIAARFFDERDRTGLRVLLGGGARHFREATKDGERTDGRNIADEFGATGYTCVTKGTEVRQMLTAPQAPDAVLGLFHPAHMPVAFDKVGAGRYSAELARPQNADYRDLPMLEEMTSLALRSLSQHAPAGFYLMVEGASIDKRAHAADAERTVWDVIEFDRAVAVALEFAARTNGDADPQNDTLVIVTADHESGGLGIIGVGNERYAPSTVGRAVRDYAAVFRFAPEQQLELFPNYAVDDKGFPVDPDPSRKLLLGWAAAPDHHENWISNRLQSEAAVVAGTGASVANPARDGDGPSADNATVGGQRIPGFVVTGAIENGATLCPSAAGCPGDTASLGHTVSGHTAADVPLSASGPGAWQFTGVYENTDVFLKILRAGAGTYAVPQSSQGHSAEAIAP